MNKKGARKHTIPAAPSIVNRKVPRRRSNAGYRSREYLTEKEVGKVIAAAATLGRHGSRDSTLILIAYRHGLRVSELVTLRWDQIDLAQGLVHVARTQERHRFRASATRARAAGPPPIAAGKSQRCVCICE